MVKLEEIQEMVADAQEAMKNGLSDLVAQQLWPAIDNALAQYSVIGNMQRMQWRDRIHNRLFGQNLQSAEPPDICIEELLREVMNESPPERPAAPDGIIPH